MAGDTVCGDSKVAFLLQNDKFPCDPLWIPTSSAALRGSKLMGDYENASGGTNNMDRSPLQMLIKEENEDFDACLNQPGKKRRLTASQVQFLERNFAAENKLEPERKLQLAKELGLQPRQIAIWFQNRRARFKNKQLETDHDFLKSSYEKLRADYDKLFKEKESLKNEVQALKEKLLVRQKSIEDLEPQNVTHSPCPELQVPFASAITQMVPNLVRVTAKQEDASSAKSDAFDSDSSHSFLVPADSSNVLELHQSDFSQDILGRSFLFPPFLTKLYHHPAATSSNFEFSVEDQPFWSWAY